MKSKFKNMLTTHHGLVLQNVVQNWYFKDNSDLEMQ
jgi:hypothetical protein